LNVTAPAAGASSTFDLPVQVTDTPTGFRYHVVP
jgi:hypothetical protein